MHHRVLRRGLSALTAGAAVAVLVVYPQPAGASDRGHGDPAVVEHDLVSDQKLPGVLQDPQLVNAWGMSHGPNTPLWVSDNGADVSTLYTGGINGGAVTKLGLVVSIPGGAPTGQVFNDTGEFDIPGTTTPAAFIFAGENGDISAWNGSQGTTAKLVGHNDGAVYKGLAIAHSPFGPLLLAANFHDNRIDVWDGSFHAVTAGSVFFRDPFLPRGYAPFNVAEIGSRVYVTYAKQDSDAHDDVAGPGHGFIDVYTTFGVFLRRLVSRGDLNSPWGLTLAPSSFGRFAGELMVGNFGDGRIHVYDPRTGFELGTVRDAMHHAIVIDGLWGLLVGDQVAGGTDAVWFSAGPDEESHGLLGTLTSG
jgi:uncharacterized protein (TIGR03118 family)